MYAWNSCEILQVLLTYFISLIITQYLRFLKNLQCMKIFIKNIRQLGTLLPSLGARKMGTVTKVSHQIGDFATKGTFLVEFDDEE